MSEPVILAWIGVIGTILTALVGKVSWDSHRTRRDTAAVHGSINNRPTTVSDRLDVLLEEVQAVRTDVLELQASASDIRADYRALRRRVLVLEREK